MFCMVAVGVVGVVFGGLLDLCTCRVFVSKVMNNR